MATKDSKEKNMEELKSREHDFSSKLRQESVIKRLREYISWQRTRKTKPGGQRLPHFGPISINLDLTLACNFSCPHCVDSMIINAGKNLRLEDIRKTISLLHSKGLLSVILVGGGEPTLHQDFGRIVTYVKKRRLQLGIVTNGSRLEKIAEVAEQLEKKDWIRISIDAAREETFRVMHQPRTDVALDQILEKASNLKKINPAISLGYSFVIVWEGMEIDGKKLSPNINEIAESVELARKHSFDYVSFKPCLVRLKDSQRESLLDKVNKEEEEEIIEKIKMNLEMARRVAGDQIKILESVNLKAMLNKETDRIKKQPRRCHMQFFRTVVTPSGIFHCPAFRGIERAKIAESVGYIDRSKFDESLRRTAKSISTFDAKEECKVVGCFYHQTNWWLEDFVNSERDVNEMAQIKDDNFFL